MRERHSFLSNVYAPIVILIVETSNKGQQVGTEVILAIVILSRARKFGNVGVYDPREFALIFTVTR